MGIIDRFRSRNRVDDVEEARRLAEIENEARNRREEEKRKKRLQEEDEPNEAKPKGKSLIYPTTIVNVGSKKNFWFWVLLLFIIFLIISWYYGLIGKYLNYIGISVLVIVFISLIGYGLGTGITRGDATKIFISVALLLWLWDLVPASFPTLQLILGPPFQGFELPINFTIPWIAVASSGFFFFLLYVDMIFKIIKRDVS